MSLEQIKTKYEIEKEQMRARQKRYYDKHKEQILEKKLQQRVECRELKAQQNPVEPVTTETPEQIIEQPVFSSLTKKDVKGIKKTTKSTTNYKEILERLKNFSLSGSPDTYKSYKNATKQLYAITGTPKDKPINFNNPIKLFKSLDEIKKSNGQIYSIHSLFSFIQVIVILSDPANNFGLDVDKSALTIYKHKFDEFKILKARESQRNKEKEVPLFTTILSKAKEEFGEKSEFYLYLRLFQLSPLRDDFQLNIVNDIKKANRKHFNYIVVPAKNATGYLIFNEYKTSTRYEQLKYELTKDVIKLVKDWIEEKGLGYNQDNYLFGEGPMSKWVKLQLKRIEIDEKGQSLNLLRHAIVSEFHLLSPNASAKEQLLFSLSLGHSPEMDKQYIRKIGG